MNCKIHPEHELKKGLLGKDAYCILCDSWYDLKTGGETIWTQRGREIKKTKSIDISHAKNVLKEMNVE